MAALTSWQVAMDFGAGFVDVTADVLLGAEALRFRYGMSGSGPLDRVADTGWCTFALNNDTSNSGGKLGYYSPQHTNCRSGFTWGIAVRVSFTFGGVTYYKWRGKIVEIDPVPGAHRERVTHIRCVDWMDEAARYSVSDVSIQSGARSDAVFSAVLAAMPKQPAATSIQTGQDTYPYALDDLGSSPYAATVFQNIAQSEFGYIYLKGDTTQGGTLVFENRAYRAQGGPTNAFSFANNMGALVVPKTLEMLYNRVETVVHPKRIDDTTETVVWTKSVDSVPAIQPGETITIWADFRDPGQTLSLIGATDVQTLVAVTDYNLASDPSGMGGTDLTANLSVVMTAFAAAAKLQLTNSAAVVGYVGTLQVRGRGIYDYAPVRSRSEDTVSQAAQGLQHIEIDMPYQDNATVGQGIAAYVKFLFGGTFPHIESVTFNANKTSSLLTAALAQEIGARIGIDETVTGVTQTIPATSRQYGYYIQAVEFNVTPTRVGPYLGVTWTLTPADSNAYWLLGVAGASELGDTTTLGYP